MKWIKQFEKFEEDEIDMDLIKSALLYIKDEFDLNKISYDHFFNYMIESEKPKVINSLRRMNFNNYYMLERQEKSAQITILFKLKESETKNYSLLKAVENLKSVIESSGELKCFVSDVLRDGSDFRFHHICISVYLSSCYNI